jgi:hypothetical protein
LIEAERDRARKQLAETAAHGVGKPNFRILA